MSGPHFWSIIPAPVQVAHSPWSVAALLRWSDSALPACCQPFSSRQPPACPHLVSRRESSIEPEKQIYWIVSVISTNLHRDLFGFVQSHALVSLVLLLQMRHSGGVVLANAGRMPTRVIPAWVRLVHLEAVVRVPASVQKGNTEWTFALIFGYFTFVKSCFKPPTCV